MISKTSTKPSRDSQKARQRRRLFLESLEARLCFTGTPVEELANFATETLVVGGADDVTGIAVNQAAGRFATTDSFEEVVEINSTTAPFDLVKRLKLTEISAATGWPGTAGSGPDGLTSITAIPGGFLGVATSDRSTDLVFTMDAQGGNLRRLADREIFNRGDSFNFSEVVPGAGDNQYYLAGQYSLEVLDSSGQLRRTLANGDYNGVALLGQSMFAITADGQLSVLRDATSATETLSVLGSFGKPVRDIEAGSFARSGPGLYVLDTDGDVSFWSQADLSGTKVGAPKLLFNVGAAFKLAFGDEQMYVSLDENSKRISLREQIVQFDASQLTVPEGGQATLGVRLQNAPAATVTVNVELLDNAAGGFQIVSGGTLQFTPANFREFQSVTVRAIDDSDTSIGRARLRVSGSAVIAAETPIIEQENDVHLRALQTQVEVIEGVGARRTFRVGLDAPLKEPVTASVAFVSGDRDLQAVEKSVTIAKDAWRADTYVSLTAAVDPDSSNGVATYELRAPGLAPLTLTAVEYDKDGAQSLQVLSVPDSVREGRTTSFQVVLAADPRGPLTVTTSRVGGDENLTIARHAQIQFDSSNWQQPQFVVLKANPDADSVSSSAILSVTAPGVAARTIPINIVDREGTPRVTYRTLVADYSTVPLQGETQAHDYYSRIRGDQGVFPDQTAVKIDRGFAEARVPAGSTFAGVWHSLIHPTATGEVRNLGAVLPAGIRAPYQYRTDAVVVTIADGQGEFVVEVKDPAKQNVWSSQIVTLTGGPRTLRLAMANPPANAHELAWVVKGAGSFARVTKLELELSGADLGRNEMFVWPFAQLLENFDARYGTTGDRHEFPSGAFDAINGSGVLAASVAVAADLGVMTNEDARKIVTATEAMLYKLRDDDSVRGLLPHFFERVAATGKFRRVQNASVEYSLIDTLAAWGGLLLAQQSLGMPTDRTEAALRAIDWGGLVLTDGTLSHGFAADGKLIADSAGKPTGWDYFGTESLFAGLFYSAATGKQAAIPNGTATAQTYNGSGFIDELLWMFVDPITIDRWGVSWEQYRDRAAQAQLNNYDRYAVPAFGASAGEVPLPWQLATRPDGALANTYRSYGVGVPNADDGRKEFLAPVVMPHYAAMAGSLAPTRDASQAMFDWMTQAGMLSPLNHVESLVVQQWGRTTEAYFHSLKGSWNLGLEALGAANAQLGANNPLREASRANSFLRSGLSLLGNSNTAEIRGEVINDLNANGRRDNGETGLSGRTVFLDTNLNGRRDTGETSVVTGADGSYSFTSLTPQTYYVASESPTGWTITDPNSTEFAAPVRIGDATFATTVRLDANATADLVQLNYQTGRLEVRLGAIDGSFGAPTTYAVGTGPERVTAADLDRDGDQDVIVGNWTSGTVVIGRNQGDGRLVFEAAISVGANPEALAPADLDNDGWIDLVIGREGGYTSPGAVEVLYNDRTGRLGQRQTLTAGIGNESVVVADFNRDGRLDLAAADRSRGQIVMLRNLGNRQFAAAVRAASVGEPRSLQAMDANGDGLLDLIAGDNSVTVYPSPSPAVYGDSLYVVPSRGDGTFGTPTTLKVGALPASIAQADWDGDGDTDLLVAARADRKLQVVINGGAAGLSPGPSFLVGYSQFVAPYDNDSDGDVDIILNDNTASYRLPAVRRARRVELAAGERAEGITFSSHDFQPPQITLTTSPLTNDTTPIVTVGVQDNDLVPDGTQFTIDVDRNNDGDFLDAGEQGYTNGTLKSGGASIELQPTLPVATYRLRARATDRSGNAGSSSTQTMQVVSPQGWAARSGPAGATLNDGAQAITVDGDGYTYVAGSVYATGDAGNFPGNGDLFIEKRSPTGAVVWTRQFGGTGDDRALGISVSNSGSVYISGHFAGSVDFDPGAAVVTRTSAGGLDAFVLKLDSNGNFQSVRTIGQSGGVWDIAANVAVDAQGNVFVLGRFGGSIDFDGLPDTPAQTALGNGGVFLVKYDSTDRFQWVRTIDGPDTADWESASALALDAVGNVYVGGRFAAQVDFDNQRTYPGNPDVLTSRGSGDAFVANYTAAGDFVFAKQLGASGGSWEQVSGLAVNSTGEIVATGCFQGNDFDPGDGVSRWSSNGWFDIFVTKFQANGVSAWARQIGGAWDDRGFGVTFDSRGESVISGFFNGTVDFDPSPRSKLLASSAIETSGQTGDGFALQLDTTGQLVWVTKIGGAGPDSIVGAKADAAGVVHVAGFFSGNVSVNTGATTTILTSAGGKDVLTAGLAALPGAVRGQLFNDANGNGVQDSSEASLAGRTVYVDRNGNGILDSGEPTTQSVADGSFAFYDLAAGAYSVVSVPSSGWQATSPSTGKQSVVVNSRQASVANFGQRQRLAMAAQLEAPSPLGSGSSTPSEPQVPSTPMPRIQFSLSEFWVSLLTSSSQSPSTASPTRERREFDELIDKVFAEPDWWSAFSL